MVNIYNDDGDVIGTVSYNDNLDIWNGRNWQNGGTGLHLGITKVSDGSYVLIHGSDWEGSMDYAEIISDKRAFQMIIKYNPSLLEETKFKPLKRFEETLLQEVE